MDSAEWRMIFVRNPEHAVFHWAIFHAGRRARAARAALSNNRQLLRFLLSWSQEAFGFGFEFELVGHHPGGLRVGRFSRHAPEYTVYVWDFHLRQRAQTSGHRSNRKGSRPKRSFHIGLPLPFFADPLRSLRSKSWLFLIYWGSKMDARGTIAGGDCRAEAYHVRR